MHQGDTLPNIFWQLYDENNAPMTLQTGGKLFLCIYDPVNKQTRLGAGSWTINSYSPVVATYQWDALDTSIPGQFTLSVRADYSGTIISTKEIPWTVIAVP